MKKVKYVNTPNTLNTGHFKISEAKKSNTEYVKYVKYVFSPICHITSHIYWQLQLQSTALPTELSRVVYCCRRHVHAKCHQELSQNDLEFWMDNSQSSPTRNCPGDVAQMVERSLSMWEVGGSIPPVSKCFCFTFHHLTLWGISKNTLVSWFHHNRDSRSE